MQKLDRATESGVALCGVFQCLAIAWTAMPGSVPRTGILLLLFARGMMLIDVALAVLTPLVARGTGSRCAIRSKRRPVISPPD